MLKNKIKLIKLYCHNVLLPIHYVFNEISLASKSQCPCAYDHPITLILIRASITNSIVRWNKPQKPCPTILHNNYSNNATKHSLRRQSSSNAKPSANWLSIIVLLSRSVALNVSSLLLLWFSTIPSDIVYWCPPAMSCWVFICVCASLINPLGTRALWRHTVRPTRSMRMLTGGGTYMSFIILSLKPWEPWATNATNSKQQQQPPPDWNAVGPHFSAGSGRARCGWYKRFVVFSQGARKYLSEFMNHAKGCRDWS